MTLKKKLTWGLGFLFLIIFCLGAFCSYYVGELGQESENILKDNYYSIVYSRNMLSGLDEMKNSITNFLFDRDRTASARSVKLFDSGKALFEANLKAENGNITEPRELEYVDGLNRAYQSYLQLCAALRSGSAGESAYFARFVPACEELKQAVHNVYDVNMQAVVRKSQTAKRDSVRFVNYMAILGSIGLVLGLCYFWYFPVYVSSTLSYLADKMKNLLQNSGYTLDLKTDDEAFILLEGMNVLEEELE